MAKSDIDALIADLNSEDIIKCQKARRSLVAMGHEAVPFLIEALNNEKHWIHWEAAKALSQIGDATAIDVLIKTMRDREFDLRWLAAEGLIEIGCNAVVPLLQALIDNAESSWLREGAHHVLHDMDRANMDSILQPVMLALEDVEPALEVPLAASRALDKISAISS